MRTMKAKDKKNKNEAKADSEQLQLVQAEEAGVKNAGHVEPENGDGESEPYTDNQPNINYGIGEEGLVNPNKP